MKKRVISLSLIVVMILTVVAQAAQYATIVSPLLEFEGKTANCYVEAVADKATDKVEITASLWRGNVCLQTWTKSGYEYVYLSESKSVTLGGVEYRLTADVTVNGKAFPQVETTAKCPLF